MDKQEKEQQSREQQTSAGQNAALPEKESSEPDYGNVMGGSPDENAQQGFKTGTGRQDTGETLGNP